MSGLLFGRCVAWLSGLVVLLACGLASAGRIEGIIVSIDATVSDGNGGKINGQFNRVLAAPVEFDGTRVWDVLATLSADDKNIRGPQGQLLGTMTELTVECDADPAVALNFAVLAGAADTTFSIQSATVMFPEHVNPEAYAQAGVTITDNALDGVTITGLFDGDCYQARYDNTVVWANLVESFSAPAEGGLTHSDRQPPSGRSIINDSMTSIESEFNFTLSKNDQASGTSRFFIVPEPGVLGLLVIGGLFGMRRAGRR